MSGDRPIATVSGAWAALRRVAPLVFLGLFPVFVLTFAAITALRADSLGVDFRGELYPQAELVLQGENPFTDPDADLSGGVNRIFPIPAALLATPFTVLPAAAAAGLFAALLLVALGATAWVMGVRDWRIYGLLALWPASLAALQTGNLSIVLGLLVALAWRYRERRYLPGIAIGGAIALKLFLWPLLVWLLALRSYRAAAAAAAISIAGVLAVLPFADLGDFVRLERNLANTFEGQSYNLIGLLMQSGVASRHIASPVSACVGLAVLTAAYLRRSLPLALAASLLLSPIVWLHYFVLLLVPIAAYRPRLSPIWFVPLALWACKGNGEDVRERHVVIALAVLAVVTIVAEWGPFRLDRLRGRGAAPRDATTPAGP
jgi:hypothetical protein